MNKETILIVDDSEHNIDILVELLSDYEVLVATEAEVALTLLNENQVDLILLDIMMPKMDGFELCSHIKSNAQTKDIPLLFITAKTDEESIEKGYELGAVDYITKPFKPKELRSRVKTHLQLRSHIINLEGLLEVEMQKYQEQQKIIQAQAKSAALGDMIDAIAHQWNQPLTIINMRINNLMFDYEDGIVDDEYIEHLTAKTQGQVMHLTQTMQEFRNFLKPVTRIKPFEAELMVKNALFLMQDTLLSKGINCNIQTKNDFIIQGNENEIKHIIINIVNNAKDAIVEFKANSLDIDITIDTNTISIQNYADTIPARILKTIFEPQVTTKEKKGGSGMGLYLSTQIIEKYHGKIIVENISALNCVKFTISFNNC